MGEEKYSPDFVKMELGEVQGAAKAAKNMADRRFKKFEADVQEVIDEGRYDKDNHQLIKDLKRDMDPVDGSELGGGHEAVYQNMIHSRDPLNRPAAHPL